MKFALVIVLLSVFVAVLGRPGNSDATIIDQDIEFTPVSYHYNFETSDQTKKDELGLLQNENTEQAYYAVTGSYRYIDPDGQTVEVKYTADEHGFQPEGTIINEAIVRAARVLGVPGTFTAQGVL